jgi:hypothetical protein
VQASKEVEQRITSPMEKLLWEIPGVEYVYTTSSSGHERWWWCGSSWARTKKESIVRLQSKLMANMDRIPCCREPASDQTQLH